MTETTAPPGSDGFEVPEDSYRLVFEGMDGLVVYARPPSIGQLMEITVKLPGAMARAEAPGTGVAARMEAIDALLRMFAGFLDSWNLKRKGQPVPATYEGLVSLDPGFAMRIVNGMRNTFVTAPPPLPDASGPGPGENPEISMPMETHSSPPS